MSSDADDLLGIVVRMMRDEPVYTSLTISFFMLVVFINAFLIR